MDDVPARGEADLSLVEKGSPSSGGGRVLNVGVTEHDISNVAAELERDAFE